MKIRLLLVFAASLAIGFGGCRSEEYCEVKGTVKGVEEGAKIEMQDAWNQYKVIATASVKDGAFAFHPNISAPTHVYLYQGDTQLKDFFLEPGTIFVDVDASDERDCFAGATGTVSNDALRTIKDLAASGDMHAGEVIQDEIMSAETTGPLAIYFADGLCKSSAQALRALDRLSSDLAGKAFVKNLQEELTRRAKTEPREEGSDFIPLFIDMEYPDANGNVVSLRSVVDNPDNRYVLLDFWATWCGPCLKALPQLIEVYAKYHENGFEIYSVSEDSSDKRWKPFLKENGMTWINVLDNHPGRKDSKAWKNYALNGIPTFVLIDGETGEIIARGNYLDLDAILSEKLL